jgi:hypothetical protein
VVLIFHLRIYVGLKLHPVILWHYRGEEDGTLHCICIDSFFFLFQEALESAAKKLEEKLEKVKTDCAKT